MSDTAEIHISSEKKPPKKKTLCVDIYGGPGTGKSIQQALVFARLKMWGVDAVMSMEAAKRYVYSKSEEIHTQEGLFGDQLRELELFNGKVDVIVCEAPLLFNIIYDKMYSKTENKDFHRSVANVYNDRFRHLEFLLTRVHDYSQDGRYQDEKGAREVDNMIRQVLKDCGRTPIEIEPYEESAFTIARTTMKALGRKPPM